MPPGAGDGSRFDTGRQDVKIIPQEIDGIRYRSSLEARWAIFFKEARISFAYEPEGFVIGGRPYRPDFLLRDCGTWVEVKGDPDQLDLDLMQAAAVELPKMSAKLEHGPRMLILGDIPEHPGGDGDWGWLGLYPAYPQPVPKGEYAWDAMWYGFGSYHKNLRPWWLENQHPYPSTGAATAATADGHEALTPAFDPDSFQDPEIRRAYFYARAYRFGR